MELQLSRPLVFLDFDDLARTTDGNQGGVLRGEDFHTFHFEVPNQQRLTDLEA